MSASELLQATLAQFRLKLVSKAPSRRTEDGPSSAKRFGRRKWMPEPKIPPLPPRDPDPRDPYPDPDPIGPNPDEPGPDVDNPLIDPEREPKPLRL
jgi:hypothetical protein